jgi:3-oxoacid CoA-transferase subunit B
MIQVIPEGLLLSEIRPGVTLDEVQRLTEPKLITKGGVRPMEF